MQPLNFNVERLLTRLTVGRSWPSAVSHLIGQGQLT